MVDLIRLTRTSRLNSRQRSMKRSPARGGPEKPERSARWQLLHEVSNAALPRVAWVSEKTPSAVVLGAACAQASSGPRRRTAEHRTLSPWLARILNLDADAVGIREIDAGAVFNRRQD